VSPRPAAALAGAALLAAALVAIPSAAHSVPYAFNYIGFDSLSWVPDRTAPSGGYTVVPDGPLTLEVDASNASAAPGFYRTEGINAAISGIDGISATLTVDEAWESVASVRAGLWLTAPQNEGGSDGDAWPIIEFTNVDDGGDFDGSPVFRIYGTFDTGTWTEVAPAEYGRDYTLTVFLNHDSGDWEFYLDGVKVGSLHDDGYTTQPKQLIFNSFNPAGADDYTVVWSGLAVVDYDLTQETSLLPNRIAGPDRYGTASAIAAEWDEYFDASTVFVTTGENYPDALSAAAAAAHLGAPVLLTKKNSLPSVVKSRLNALHPDRIVVLGSTAAVSSTVFNALKTVSGSPEVVRWQGADRYATMREIVKNAWGVDGDGDGAENRHVPVIIATGRNFPDALSAGPAASYWGGAVILVDGSKSSIPAATLNLIRDLEPDRIVIAGSTAAVKSGIESQLRSVFGSADIWRAQGPDRYATSAALNNLVFDAADAVFFATGANFPDALAGAALAGALRHPLIVTQKSCVTSPVKSFVSTRGATKKVLLGSSATLKDSVAALKSC